MVSSIKQKTGGYEVTSSRGTIEAEHVVMAGGAWTDLNRRRYWCDAGDDTCQRRYFIYPARREAYYVHHSRSRCIPCSQEKRHGHCRATEHPGSMESRVYAGSIHDLLKSAFTLVPDLAGAEFKQAWSGVRPQSADGMPYLGSVDNQGLWMAAGHYRNGILLSAGTGDWLARSICGEPVNAEWEKAFSPRRKRIKEGVSSEAHH